MGIKDLKQAIAKYCPENKKQIKYSELSGKTITVDTSIYLYKFKYGDNNFLYRFLKQIEWFYKNDIKLIYVFDGKPPQEKNNIISERRNIKKQKYERKEQIESKIIQIDDELKKNEPDKLKIYSDQKKILKGELKKINNSIINITDKDIQLLKDLFDICNIQYICANTEAELICSHLTISHGVFGCLTDDTDVLPNKCINFLTDYNFKSNFLTVYSYDDVVSGLKMTDDEFIDFCILCGCDYSPKIRNLGYVTAYKFITKYKSIESILENTTEKYNLSEEFLKKYNFNDARKIFNNNEYEYIIENEEEKEIDSERLKTFITEHSIKINVDTFLVKNSVKKESKKKDNAKKKEHIKKKEEVNTNITNFIVKKKSVGTQTDPVPKSVIQPDTHPI